MVTCIREYKTPDSIEHDVEQTQLDGHLGSGNGVQLPSIEVQHDVEPNNKNHTAHAELKPPAGEEADCSSNLNQMPSADVGGSGTWGDDPVAGEVSEILRSLKEGTLRDNAAREELNDHAANNNVDDYPEVKVEKKCAPPSRRSKRKVKVAKKYTEDMYVPTADLDLNEAPKPKQLPQIKRNPRPKLKVHPAKSEESTSAIDLSDVPKYLPPIRRKYAKEGSSRFVGVTFVKDKKKWKAQLDLKGMKIFIGYYKTQEQAGIDFARAKYKFKGQRKVVSKARRPVTTSSTTTSTTAKASSTKKKAGKKRALSSSASRGSNAAKKAGKKRALSSSASRGSNAAKKSKSSIGSRDGDKVVKRSNLNKNLSNPLPRSGILRRKPGDSKYVGVTYQKSSGKWKASIMVDRKSRRIGYYDNEADAGMYYAQALLKYRGQKALDEAIADSEFNIDGVPPRKPILKSDKNIDEGSSKYIGATFDSSRNKWKAQIKFKGKLRHLGYYDNDYDAAIDYARALFKVSQTS